jgi:hypothetical protein
MPVLLRYPAALSTHPRNIWLPDSQGICFYEAVKLEANIYYGNAVMNFSDQ